jgi:hypothetical protein
MIGVGAIVVFAVQVGVDISRPAPVQSAGKLSEFLAAHDLRSGIGDYWSSSLVTADTGGTVAVRPVATSGGEIVRFDRQSAAQWYKAGEFRFLVFDTARPWHGVNAASAVRTFGAPSRSYSVGSYRVLSWNHGLTVSSATPNYGSPLKVFWGLTQSPVTGHHA